MKTKPWKELCEIAKNGHYKQFAVEDLEGNRIVTAGQLKDGNIEEKITEIETRVTSGGVDDGTYCAKLIAAIKSPPDKFYFIVRDRQLVDELPPANMAENTDTERPARVIEKKVEIPEYLKAEYDLKLQVEKMKIEAEQRDKILKTLEELNEKLKKDLEEANEYIEDLESDLDDLEENANQLSEAKNINQGLIADIGRLVAQGIDTWKQTEQRKADHQIKLMEIERLKIIAQYPHLATPQEKIKYDQPADPGTDPQDQINIHDIDPETFNPYEFFEGDPDTLRAFFESYSSAYPDRYMQLYHRFANQQHEQ